MARATCLARPADLLRSYTLRTAILTACMVLLVAGLGMGFGYWQSERLLRENLDAALRAEAEGLLAVQLGQGIQAMVTEVAGRARLRPGSPIVATLQTLDGQRIAGAPLELPQALVGYDSVPLPGAGSLRALGLLVPGGLNLVVGADTRTVLDTAATLSRSLLLAGAAAVVLAPLFGLWLARRTDRRLAAISAATATAIGGELSRRLPLSGAGDEFDRLAGTINHALDRLQAQVAGLRQVTDDMAHDLRSPLSRLRQRLEAALERARDPAADTETLENALAELDGVLATFAGMLRLARLEARTDAPATQVDLSALVAGMVETYAAVAAEQGKTLAADIAPGQTVRGEPALLRQALANLIENALLHGGRHVRVALTAGAELLVSDDGPGIPPQDRARVLQRFVRLDAARGTPGTGLGLALVAAVARLHGARLALEDAGPGLRVRLALPPARG